MYMKTSAISIPMSNTTVSLIGSNVLISTCPPRCVLYGSPSNSYIPLQHQPMPSRSCPENIGKMQILSRSPHYLSSDSEDKDKDEDDAFDGTFNSNNPLVAQIFENVAKKLFEESLN